MIDLLPRHVKLERVAITCPLGMRFYDVATGGWVNDGLVVEAYREVATTSPPGSGGSAGESAEDIQVKRARRVRAIATRSGVAAFHGLPGLAGFEYGADDERRWLDAPAPASFRVEVSDPAGRFLPCTFLAAAPTKGLFGLSSAASPPWEASPAVPLFSAPARPVPGGFAVLRAQLLRFPDREPAAWTLAEVSTRINSRTVTACGLADHRGVLALMFPYPEPLNVSPGSPPGNGPQLLSQQHWTLDFRAWHAFDAVPGEFADLDRVLALQERPADAVWESDSPLAPFTQAELIFGRELIVPARALGDERSRELFITPAVSPP